MEQLDVEANAGMVTHLGLGAHPPKGLSTTPESPWAARARRKQAQKSARSLTGSDVRVTPRLEDDPMAGTAQSTLSARTLATDPLDSRVLSTLPRKASKVTRSPMSTSSPSHKATPDYAQKQGHSPSIG